MKRSLLYIGIALLAIVSFSSCGKGKGGNSKNPFMATSSGRPYELIVVTDLGLWERPAGRALKSALTMDVPGLPQSEESFKVMYTAPSNFDMTLKLIRNIVIVDIQDIYTQAKFNYASDVYASPQMVLTIQSPNEEEFETYVEENREVIVDFFTRAEMNRQIRNLEKNHNDYVTTKVSSMFDCEVWVPGELGSSKAGEDFFWASTNAATSDMSFVIYSYPYTDNRTFTRDFYMHKRDSVMKVNMPGSRDGVYMATDTMTVETRPITVQGEYALEARGLWKMKGDFMGGPFVSHTRLDKANNRVVTVEVFIYSPDKLKKNLVRLMEASLYTLKFPSQQVQNQEQNQVGN